MACTGFPCGSAGKESACNMGDLGLEEPLEKGKATHSSILAWRIPRKQLSDFHFHGLHFLAFASMMRMHTF